MAELMNIAEIVRKVLGEQNLYKMDYWREPNKPCRHNNTVFCVKCKKEIEGEKLKCLVNV